jgi:putative ABC transport system permease protein
VSHFNRDLRFAARTLAQQPGFTLAAVLTLALGIGGNTAIFSIVDSVLLNPPPFRDPDRVAVVWAANPALAQAAGLENKLPVSGGDFYDWQRENRSFASLAMVEPETMTLTGQGEPKQFDVVRVTGDFSKVLGTPAALGRTIEPADDAPGTPSAILLSNGGWHRRFGGDPKIVGRKVTLNGNPVTVVGVMPPRFAFPRGSEMPSAYGFPKDADAWVPLALPTSERYSRKNRYFVALGRLRPGVSLKAAEDDMKAICERLAKAYPETDKEWSARLLPITEQMVGDVRPALLVLWVAGSLVLLIACANVGNLLLARAASRQREIAVRTAIGANRRRLMTQLLAESALLSVLGGTLGIAVAAVGLRLSAVFIPPGIVGGASFSIDGRGLAFTMFLCTATTLLAGLIPSLQMTRPDLARALREGTRAGSGTVMSRRTRNALVISEVALAVLLMIGAGLLLRSYVRLLAVHPGFQTEGILTFQVDLQQDRYAPLQRLSFYDRVVEKLQALPGVAAAGAVSELPLSGVEAVRGVYPEGKPIPKSVSEATPTDWRKITPDYLKAMQIPLLQGRLLTPADATGKLPVAVIDKVMAQSCWSGQSPLGKRFRLAKPGSPNDDPDNPWVTVVGVVGSIRHSGLYAEPRAQIYGLQAHTPAMLMPYQVVFVVRTLGDPRSLSRNARAAVYSVDPNQPITNLRTMEQVVSDSVGRQRFNMLLLGLFAALALMLSVVGIYGITAYNVTQRTRELGLRMALGAQPGGVLGLVLKEAGMLAGLGVVLGVAAAFALTRVMASLLYGVGSTDPLTFVTVCLGLCVLALIAAYLPGRRATRIDPIVALRTE